MAVLQHGAIDAHRLSAVIPPELAGNRLDQAVSRIFMDYSRTALKDWILEGRLLVNGQRKRPRDLVAEGEQVELWVETETETTHEPEAIPLHILHEDEDLIVLNKPAGLVVHPGAGNREGTLLNALLHHDAGLANLPRAGIVHRLDKDTSGLLVIARTLRAHTRLVRQLQARSLTREYQAIVQGVMVAGGSVDLPIGRHPTERTRMAIVEEGREAITHYRVIQRFRAHTHIQVKLETGRTHQIRVHMAHLRYPIVGDPVYGKRLAIPAGASPELAEALREFKRQALHASRLQLLHPATGEIMEWSAPLPEDMTALLALLAADVKAHA
jgi:23S rRNA pseudouridine1911/1915/1917 synthase